MLINHALLHPRTAAQNFLMTYYVEKTVLHSPGGVPTLPRFQISKQSEHSNHVNQLVFPLRSQLKNEALLFELQRSRSHVKKHRKNKE